MWLLSVVFATMIFTSLSDALPAPSACEEIDLHASPNSPFNKIPIYDQDGTGLCYSYAAAQIADYYLIKNSQKIQRVNPVYAAWLSEYKTKNFFTARDGLDGGQIYNVLRAIKSQGVCSDADVRKKLAELKNAGNFTDAEALYFLETAYSTHENSRSLFGFGRANPNWAKSVGRNASDFLRNPGCVRATTWLKSRELAGVATTAALEQIFDGCRSNTLRLPEVRVTDSGSDQVVGAEISRSLKSGYPVAASFACANQFFSAPGATRKLKGWSPPLWRSSRGNLKSCQGNDGGHAIVVGGQKTINGACHYFIRNSWGAFWVGQGATNCACRDAYGKYKSNCKSEEAREILGCWYKKSDVLPNLAGVTSFE